MKENYKGIIIAESLENADVLEDIKVISKEAEPDQDNPNETWHLYTVQVSQDEIKKLQQYLKREGGWYMHFWRGREVTVVFRDKIFKINYDNKSTWKDAVDYGLSMGVPAEQLDFLIE